MIGCRFCCLACPVAGGGARRRDQNAPKASCSAVGALWKYAATLVLRQTDRFNLMCSLSHHFPSMQSTTRVGNTSKDFDLMPRYDLLDRGLQRQVEAVARLDASFWHQVSTYNRCVDHKPIILNTKLFWVTNEIWTSGFLSRSLGVLRFSLLHGDWWVICGHMLPHVAPAANCRKQKQHGWDHSHLTTLTTVQVLSETALNSGRQGDGMWKPASKRCAAQTHCSESFKGWANIR